MKYFIVFSAVVALATANVVGRSDWGSNPSSVQNIDLQPSTADDATATTGVGQASGHQALSEYATGENVAGPSSSDISTNEVLTADNSKQGGTETAEEAELDYDAEKDDDNSGIAYYYYYYCSG